MEWILVAVGLTLAVVFGLWFARRRSSSRRSSPAPTTHTGSSTTTGVENSMSMRLPTGGNSGA